MRKYKTIRIILKMTSYCLGKETFTVGFYMFKITYVSVLMSSTTLLSHWMKVFFYKCQFISRKSTENLSKVYLVSFGIRLNTIFLKFQNKCQNARKTKHFFQSAGVSRNMEITIYVNLINVYVGKFKHLQKHCFELFK